MKSVIIFNQQYKPLMTIKTTESRPQSFVPALKTIEVTAGTRDEKIADWLYSRFNNGDEIRMEIQLKKRKIVIKNAYIANMTFDSELTLTTVHIISQDFVYMLGPITTKVWSVS